MKLSVQLLLCLIGITFCTFFLQRIYEVPVKTVEVKILSEGFEIDTGAVHITIVRDYDRTKSASDDHLRNASLERKGYIGVQGALWVEHGDKQLLSTFRDNLDSVETRKVNAFLDTTRIKEPRGVGFVSIQCNEPQRLVRSKGYKHSYYYGRKIRKDIQTDYFHYGVFGSKPFENKYASPKGKFTFNIDEYIEDITVNVDSGISRYEYVSMTSMRDSVIPIDCYYFSSGFNTPKIWSTMEDISKCITKFKISEDCTPFISSITFDFKGCTDFGHLIPVPDEQTFSSIRYTAKEKLNQIAWNGLVFHASFPEMQNIQEMRIFAVTVFLTLLVTIACALLTNLIGTPLKRLWQKHPLKWSLAIAIFAILMGFLIYRMYVYSETNNVEVQNELKL